MALNDPSDAPWWRDAVVYQVYVRSFADSNGDGLGDLPGITQRLPYLRDLGVDALWITPFYPSPQHDAGYDVSDYVDVDPRFGDLADADALLAKAHELGLKVVVDLVPNHTSDEHEWFQKALAAEPGSPERERYIFRDGKGRGRKQPPNNWNSVFGGIAWEQVDDGADRPGQWYLHIFDRTQPDLELAQPRGRSDVRATCCGSGSTVASTASGSTSPTACSRTRGCATRRSPSPTRGTLGVHARARAPRTSRCGTSPRSTRSTATGAGSSTEYDGDRMAVAEAWTQTPERPRAFVRPDELQQAFNFAWLLAGWDAADIADCHPRHLRRARPRRRQPDVGAVQPRRGPPRDAVRRRRRSASPAPARPRWRCWRCPGRRTSTRARSSASRASTSPEELRRTPPGSAPARVARRLPGADAVEGTGRRSASAAGRAAVAPAARATGRTSPSRRRRASAGSTLEFYRKALKVGGRSPPRLRRDVEILERGETVLAFRRGPLTVVLNAGTPPVPLPEGEVLVYSGRLVDGKLPAEHRRLAALTRRSPAPRAPL